MGNPLDGKGLTCTSFATSVFHRPCNFNNLSETILESSLTKALLSTITLAGPTFQAWQRRQSARKRKNLVLSKEKIRYTLFSFYLLFFYFFFHFFFTPHQTTLEPPVLCIYLSSTRISFLPYFLFSPSVFFFAFILSFFFLFFFLFVILFSVLTLSFLILSSASLYFYLLLFPALPFFYVNTFKLYPSKRTNLNNIVSTFMIYPRPAFLPSLFCFTHFPLFVFFIYKLQSSHLVWLLHLRNI